MKLTIEKARKYLKMVQRYKEIDEQLSELYLQFNKNKEKISKLQTEHLLSIDDMVEMEREYYGTRLEFKKVCELVIETNREVRI